MHLRIVALACVAAVGAFAQAGAGQGSISGLVLDATGAAVPGATVTVTQESKGVLRKLETTGDGLFNAPALVPSEGYKVSVSKQGFANYEATDVLVTVGQNVGLRITLAVGSTVTSVDVSAQSALVDETKTDISQLVGQRQILELPINGRRVDSFVLLTPAVVPDGAFGLLSFRGVAGHNAFLTDGNDTTNSFYNENAGRTRIQSQISQEAVQEFQVISNNMGAEYGQAMGGVVNTITKSGTNDVHGTAYWFFRNRSLNARDRYSFLFGQPINTQDIRHQAGASLGGAIKKDKLFYYLNYEATRRDFPAVALLSNNNMFNGLGQFLPATNPCPNPAVAAALQATVAQCQAATNLITTRNFGTVSRTVTQDLGFAKVDYHINDANTLTLSLSMLRWVSPHGIQATGIVFGTGNAIGNNADSTVRNAFGKAQLTTIVTPNIVNEARFGWFKDRLYDAASDDFLFPGGGRASITVNGVSNLGVANSYPRLNPSERRFQFADNVSWIRGAHTMKFGIDYNTTLDYVNQLINQYGSYTYNSLNDFARDFTSNGLGNKSWNQYSQAFGNPIVETTTNVLALYGQDQWRVTPNLTFNFGLRYDYTFIPQPSTVNPDYPQTGTIHSAKDNFAPRAGLAYTFGKDRRTILRAGYGIFYARYQTGLIENLFLSNGVYQKSITYAAATPAQLAAGPVFPNYLPSTNFNPPAGTLDIFFADKDFKNPYTHQGNVSLERSISSTMSLTASYIWSRGVRLYGVRDLNVWPAANPVTYTILDPSGAVAGTFTTNTYRGQPATGTARPDTRYRRVSQIENPGLSYYNGLSLQLNKRFSHGFQGGMSYTWSHAIDFNQSFASNNIFFSATPTTYENGNFAAEKGSAANDVRHRLVINGVWAPTFTKSDSWAARYLINNWQLSQVTTLQSAQPVNSTVSVSGSPFTGALVAGSLNGLAGSFRVPFQPVSNVNLDQIYRVDARVAKKLPFSERVTGYLQLEGFNIFNTPYDTSRNGQEYTFANCPAGQAVNATCPAGPSGLTLRFNPTYNAPTSTATSPDGTNARRAQVSLRVTF